jgi:hypothetical protein
MTLIAKTKWTDFAMLASYGFQMSRNDEIKHSD